MTTLARHLLIHTDGRRTLIYGALSENARLSDAPMEVTGIHQRFDLLTREWVAISPARNQRPLDSASNAAARRCPICPGGAELPFPYEAAVFENRFPSFMAAPPDAPPYRLANASKGRCEVVVYTPRHDASFAGLSATEMARVLAIWTDRSNELWADPQHEFVLVFENRGADAGATLTHPHGQIYALDRVPPRAAVKASAHSAHRAAYGRCLGCALIADAEDREIAPNASFAVAVPFAPRWPYEVAVRARRHGAGRLSDLAPQEIADLGNALRSVAIKLDYVFAREVPYLMVAQEAPRDQSDWHLAFEFYPLLRSASALKIRASVETASGVFLNDVVPEEAAHRLVSADGRVDPLTAGDLLRVVHD